MFLPGGPGIPQPRTGLSLGQGGTQQMPSSGPAETLPPSVHTHPAEAISPALSPGEWESSAGPSAMSLSPQRNSSHRHGSKLQGYHCGLPRVICGRESWALVAPPSSGVPLFPGPQPTQPDPTQPLPFSVSLSSPVI